MKLFDVNVLVAAHRADHPRHAALRPYLDRQLNGDEPFGMSELVLSAFVRIVTNPRAFADPLTTDHALAAVQAITGRDACVLIRPGDRHFGLFLDLCRRVGARGNLVPDAYLAALAIEHRCRWVSDDRGFARFPGLNWATPEQDAAGQP